MLTKERVFEIMGEFYGNAHYESAIRLGISEHDLALETEFLDAVNGLGYHFDQTYCLQSVEDTRFPPIVLAYFNRFESKRYQLGMLNTIRFHSYAPVVPQLISIYKNTQDCDIRDRISQDLLQIGSKKYASEYLEIVNQEQYGKTPDFMIELLCKLKVDAVKPKLLSLINQEKDSRMWTFWSQTFLKNVHVFKDPSLIPYVQPYLMAEDAELRGLAKKAMKKLEAMPQN